MVEDNTTQKLKAAASAVDLVESGMIVGLGHGSTAELAMRRMVQVMLGGRLENIIGIPCSEHTEKIARELDIPLSTLEEHPEIDVTIDGADEVDPNLDLIKGGGGALLREKLVAQASAREVIVVDGSKCTERLGTRFPLPVEVVDFGLATTRLAIERLGARLVLRGSSEPSGPFRTDQGNLIFDCELGPIEDAESLAAELASHAGVVEHGLFLGITSALIVASDAGIEVSERPDG
jgi:ribose 5-phosphate isomerase A